MRNWTNWNREKMERPILFSTEMVRAILDGRKTQTRRVVKDKMLQENNGDVDEEFLLLTMDKCPYGKVGNVLWVRETYRHQMGSYRYKASPNVVIKTQNMGASMVSDKWKPSIFMPKAACRIFLEITSIRVERLQDISEQDAKAEGTSPKEGIIFKRIERYDEAFERLWISINGLESWDSNPWVWVIEFKQTAKTQTNE